MYLCFIVFFNSFVCDWDYGPIQVQAKICIINFWDVCHFFFFLFFSFLVKFYVKVYVCIYSILYIYIYRCKIKNQALPVCHPLKLWQIWLWRSEETNLKMKKLTLQISHSFCFKNNNNNLRELHFLFKIMTNR